MGNDFANAFTITGIAIITIAIMVYFYYTSLIKKPEVPLNYNIEQLTKPNPCALYELKYDYSHRYFIRCPEGVLGPL